MKRCRIMSARRLFLDRRHQGAQKVSSGIVHISYLVNKSIEQQQSKCIRPNFPHIPEQNDTRAREREREREREKK